METFVVRVWVPAEPEPEAVEPALHGLVERVGDGRPRPFADGEALLALLREAALAPRTDDRDAPSEEESS